MLRRSSLPPVRFGAPAPLRRGVLLASCAFSASSRAARARSRPPLRASSGMQRSAAPSRRACAALALAPLGRLLVLRHSSGLRLRLGAAALPCGGALRLSGRRAARRVGACAPALRPAAPRAAALRRRASSRRGSLGCPPRRASARVSRAARRIRRLPLPRALRPPPRSLRRSRRAPPLRPLGCGLGLRLRLASAPPARGAEASSARRCRSAPPSPNKRRAAGAWGFGSLRSLPVLRVAAPLLPSPPSLGSGQKKKARDFPAPRLNKTVYYFV